MGKRWPGRRPRTGLDGPIRRIRLTIFVLQGPEMQELLRGRLHTLVDAATEHQGFAPSVRLGGLLDTAVDDETGEHVLAVVQEALSNVARHARATETTLRVDVGDELTVRVDDNGVGIGTVGGRSGLRSMAGRRREARRRMRARSHTEKRLTAGRSAPSDHREKGRWSPHRCTERTCSAGQRRS
ncbi:sensor histidine kinase [Actinomadura sp. 3N508]|uniref:sensor histidine kinase n=1 Tax=Actinomadura sp. 3N508 TaxID=3375153 RepID=UPI0037A727FA